MSGISNTPSPKQSLQDAQDDSVQAVITKAYTTVGYLYAQSLLGTLSPLKAGDLLKAEQGIIEELNTIKSDPSLNQKEQLSVQSIIQDVQEAEGGGNEESFGLTYAYLQFGMGFNLSHPEYLQSQEGLETQGFVSLCTIYNTLQNPNSNTYSLPKLFENVFSNLKSLLNTPQFQDVKTAIQTVQAQYQQNPDTFNGQQLAAQLQPALATLLPFFQKMDLPPT